MGGPNKDENGEIRDISYVNWVEKNEAIKHLCEAYEVIYSTDDKDILAINNIIKNNYISSNDNKSLRNPSGILENHDFACELKLLKWITEDEKHKNEFISLNFNTEIKLNQYNDILPYKYNIVNLDKNNKEEININNYINASFIANPLNNKQKIIIATQTPLKDTVNSFWKMIYNYKVKLIVMISDTKKEEENINDANNINKAYFPQEKENIMNIDISKESKMKIELIHKEEIAPNMAFLKIFKINDEYELKHIQIISWGNKCLPGDMFITNVLIEKIYKNFKDQIKSENPVVIHCYDGVGRTGTLISIFLTLMCLEGLKRIKKEPIMGIFNLVRKLREQRYSSVTDVEHYKYIYDFAFYWIKKNNQLKK
jgi:protein tyrosine phosphatase